MMKRLIFVMLLGSAVAQVTNPPTSANNLSVTSVNMTGAPGCLVNGVACSSQNLLSDAALIVRSNSPVTYSVADTFGTSGFLITGTGTGTTTLLGPTTAGAFNLLWPAITANSNLLADTTITPHILAVPQVCTAASASGTAYTCATSPTFTPVAGDEIIFGADVASTGAVTLNVNSTSAATVNKGGGSTALVANDFLANKKYLLVFDAAGVWETEGQTGGPLPPPLGGTGLSSCTANALMVGGNATANSCPTGIKETSSLFTTYGALATAGNGVASVQAAPAAVVIGSGTSLSAASLCSTTLCPVGDYIVHAYLDITTPCTTTGSYIVWVGWTDGGGAHTGSSTTTFIPFQVNGSGVTTVGTLVPTAGTYANGTFFLRTTGAATSGLGSINFGTTATACGTGGPMVGNLYLDVTRMR